MKNEKLFGCVLLLLFSVSCFSQTVMKQNNWEWHISKEGYAEYLVYKGSIKNDTISFFKKWKNDGPSFYIKNQTGEQKGKWIPDGRNSFHTAIDGIYCELSYIEHNSYPAIKVKMRNDSFVAFQPIKAGVKLGVDIYMNKYPDWYGKYFPTLMRCEKTHFYGYLQTPNEHTLAIVSEQPVASWSIDYNYGYGKPPYDYMGHRLESLNLDLINARPLPGRHPQDLYELKQDEEKTWIISFINIGTLEDLEKKITQKNDIPVIKLEQTSYKRGEEATFEVYASNPYISIQNDKGEVLPVNAVKLSQTQSKVTTILPEAGIYTIKVTDKSKQAEAILSVHSTWQWTLEQARKSAIKYHQKATSHAESWYGFYSAFISAKYFPNKKEDQYLTERFDYLFNLLHDTTTMIPKYYASRIQNTSTTIGMLVDKYEAEGNPEDLKKATMLADWLINTWQKENGGYYNHNTIYTSVIYIAKSILELAIVEEKLALDDPYWKQAHERHFHSAKRAIDQLIGSQGNYDTEGEVTFDESTIACSALQMGMFALLQKDDALKNHYRKAMLEILNSHSCVTQLKVPDARQRQGTLRFWESQYDVFMLPNMFNSPHGWSGWRAYATYYAYLLTGEEGWLMETFNAAGAFASLIDYKTGNLRWAFVPDPYIEAEQACSADTHYTKDSLSFGNPHPRSYDTRKFIVGEEYINMISDWQTINSQDNDVHEVFKFIGEAVLTNAFIIERKDGTIIGYNCDIKRNGNIIEITPDEKQIVNLHCNLINKYTIKFKSNKSKTLTSNYCDWL